MIMIVRYLSYCLILLLMLISTICRGAESGKLEIQNSYRAMTAIPILEWIKNAGGVPSKRAQELQLYFARTINDEEIHSTGYVDILFREYYDELSKPGILPADFPRKIDLRFYVRQGRFNRPKLKVWTITRMLEDKILGVGLKSYPAVYDYDNDGINDLLIGDHDGFMYWYKNIGTNESPRYGRPRRMKDAKSGIDLFISHNPRITIGDIDGDNEKDIVVGSHSGYLYKLRKIKKDGKSAFTVRGIEKLRWYKHVIWFQSYAYPELVDLNSDGILDLIVGEQNGRLWTILRNKSGIWNNPRLTVRMPDMIYPCPAAMDIDGDNLTDIVMGSQDGRLYVLRNIGTSYRADYSKPKLLYDNSGKIIDVGMLSHPQAGDYNNDGLTDLLIGNDDGQVWVAINKGNSKQAEFAAPFKLKDAGGEMIMGVHPIFDVADFNKDGLADIIVGTVDPTPRLFINVGTKQRAKFDDYVKLNSLKYSPKIYEVTEEKIVKDAWNNRALKMIAEFFGNVSPYIVDWNNDGRADLLIGGYTGLLYIATNEGKLDKAGKPVFRSPILVRDSGGKPIRVAGFSCPAMKDITGDGLADLICGDLMGRIHLWRNIGTTAKPILKNYGVVQISGRSVFLSPRTTVEITDIDKDGDNDLIIGGRFGPLYAILNKGVKGKFVFEHIEAIRDCSDIWKQLYLAAWVSVIGCAELPARVDNKAYPLMLKSGVARFRNLEGDSSCEFLVSYRFGRVFVLQPYACKNSREK